MGESQSPTWQGAEIGMGKFSMVTVHTPVPWSQSAFTGFFWIRPTMRCTSARAASVTRISYTRQSPAHMRCIRWALLQVSICTDPQ